MFHDIKHLESLLLDKIQFCIFFFAHYNDHYVLLTIWNFGLSLLALLTAEILIMILTHGRSETNFSWQLEHLLKNCMAVL